MLNKKIKCKLPNYRVLNGFNILIFFLAYRITNEQRENNTKTQFFTRLG